MIQTKKQRFWFVLWCFWSASWLIAYIAGAFYNLIKYRAYGQGPSEITLGIFIEEFKLGAFLFISVIIPALLYGIYAGFSKIKSWVGEGQ